MFNDKCTISMTSAAAKFKCDKSHFSKTLKNKTEIRRYSKKTIPKRSEAQKIKIRPLCSRVLRKFPKIDFVIDDESYFGLTNVSSNTHFYFQLTKKMHQTISNIEQLQNLRLNC